MKRVILGVCIFASASAYAEVFKCNEPSGKTIYSDAPCGEQSEKIRLMPSSAGFEAVEARPVAREEYIPVRDTPRDEKRDAEEKASSYSCGVARNNLKTARSSVTSSNSASIARANAISLRECYTADGRVREQAAQAQQAQQEAEAKRARRAQRIQQAQQAQQAQRTITSCDAGGCWDNRGGRYSGSGAILFDTSGRACTRNGPMLVCH